MAIAKTLDVSTVLLDFDQETPLTIQERDATRPLRLKDVLLTYLRQAQDMNLSPPEETTAFDVGVLVATSKNGVVELEQHQYDLVKKICDNGRVIMGGGHMRSLFNVPAKDGAKRLVDAATAPKQKNAPEVPSTE